MPTCTQFSQASQGSSPDARILAKLGDFLNEAKDLEKGFGKVQPLGDHPGNLRDKARQEHCLIPVEGRKPCRLQGRPGCMG